MRHARRGCHHDVGLLPIATRDRSKLVRSKREGLLRKLGPFRPVEAIEMPHRVAGLHVIDHQRRRLATHQHAKLMGPRVQVARRLAHERPPRDLALRVDGLQCRDRFIGRVPFHAGLNGARTVCDRHRPQLQAFSMEQSPLGLEKEVNSIALIEARHPQGDHLSLTEHPASTNIRQHNLGTDIPPSRLEC